MKSSKELKLWTTRFTDYHIYFNTAEKIQYINLALPPNNSASSLANIHQRYSREIAGSIICANPLYEPRILFRNQITWKINSDDSKV